jgi:hypothetical protein
MPKCECGVTASFGYKDGKASCCVRHKTTDMINVVDVLCLNCDRRAMYNLPGKTGGIHCIHHKKDGMVNVKGKRCEYVYEGGIPCYTIPIYNKDGELKGRFCIGHKEADMVNVTGKRCEKEGCNCIAQFNVDGEQKGKFCSQHKSNGMIDVRHRKCEYEGCSNAPSYKFVKDTSCRFCATHKLEGMTNGKHTFCIFEGCGTVAGYNIITSKTPLYCGNHKKDGMVDLKHPLCIENGCDKRPVFNYTGKKNGLYCVSHKKDNMVNLLGKKCLSEWCDTLVYSKNKYSDYCIHCYIHLFPDKSVVRNYKTKEKTVVDFVLSKFENISWIADKRVQDGCSRRRPDLFLDLGSHVLVIEIDENQHTDYDCSCENKRLMEISRDIGHRPLIFIRFNPDEYIDNNNLKIKSCWKPNKQSGVLYIPTIKMNEWNNRLLLLQNQVQYWIENKPDKMVEIVQLFYDGMIPT